MHVLHIPPEKHVSQGYVHWEYDISTHNPNRINSIAIFFEAFLL